MPVEYEAMMPALLLAQGSTDSSVLPGLCAALSSLLAGAIVYRMTGHHDRFMLRRRFPHARGVWVCGWIGILPYGIILLTQLVGTCTSTLVSIPALVVREAVAVASASSPASQPAAHDGPEQVLIGVTPAAAEEIRKLQSGRDSAQVILRLVVEEDGLTGHTCRFELGGQIDPDDDVATVSQGIQIVVSRRHYPYLAETVLDYRNTPAGRGFVFDRSDGVSR